VGGAVLALLAGLVPLMLLMGTAWAVSQDP